MGNPAESSPNKIEPISIEIPLPLETNPLNDCGALSLQMVLLKDTQTRGDMLSLENLRRRLNKTFEEGADSGRICKVLKEEGYNVKYFSTLDIKSIADNDPKTAFEKWDLRVVNAVNSLQGSTLVVNKEKLHDSAKWLTMEENKEIIIKKNLSIKEIADFLREGKRVIIPVMSGAHYIVIVGVDNERIYYNDPTANETPTKKSKMHAEFIKYWAERPDMRDAIVVRIPKAGLR